jgi:hypothetical protein
VDVVPEGPALGGLPGAFDESPRVLAVCGRAHQGRDREPGRRAVDEREIASPDVVVEGSFDVA